MGKSSSPSPPDPAATARAQAQANAEAVRESAKVNQIDINSPWGRQYYTGTVGKPGRALNIELTPGAERTRSAQEQLGALLSGFGLETLGPQIMDRLAAPDSTAVEDAIYQRGLARLEPQYEEGREALRSRLIGQGLAPGSRAYEQAMGQYGRQEADALENLSLSSIAQGAAENRAQRSQSINELAALLQGAPAIGTPATQMPAQYQIAPPNIADLTMANYAGRLNQYNTQANQLGGLYNLGGQLGAAGLMAFGGPAGAAAAPAVMGGQMAFSDIRLKTDVEFVGEHRGHRWYTYRYLWDTGPERRIGVMAQEAMRICPEAVFEGPDGWLAVDYQALLVGMPAATIDCEGIKAGVVGRGGLAVGPAAAHDSVVAGHAALVGHDRRPVQVQDAVGVPLGPWGQAEALALLGIAGATGAGAEGEDD